MACVSSVNWRADTARDECKGTTWGVAQALGIQVGGREGDKLGNLGARRQDTDAVKPLAVDVFVLIL